GLSHGGTRPVLPQKGNLVPHHPKGGGDALVQQIPGEDQVQVLRSQPGPGQRQGHRLLLQLGLGLLPGVHAQAGVPKGLVEVRPQGPLGLSLAPHGGPAQQGGGPVKGQAAPAHPPHPRPPNAGKKYSSSPYTTEAVTPYTSTGPATENSFAPSPVIYPSLLNSMAGEAMELAKPVT